jgi:hypothetical protein
VLKKMFGRYLPRRMNRSSRNPSALELGRAADGDLLMSDLGVTAISERLEPSGYPDAQRLLR